MPEARKAHPYYMYQAIHDQPALIESVLAQRVGIDRMADAVAQQGAHHFRGNRNFAARGASGGKLDARIHRRRFLGSRRTIV